MFGKYDMELAREKGKLYSYFLRFSFPGELHVIVSHPFFDRFQKLITRHRIGLLKLWGGSFWWEHKIRVTPVSMTWSWPGKNNGVQVILRRQWSSYYDSSSQVLPCFWSTHGIISAENHVGRLRCGTRKVSAFYEYIRCEGMSHNSGVYKKIYKLLQVDMVNFWKFDFSWGYLSFWEIDKSSCESPLCIVGC